MSPKDTLYRVAKELGAFGLARRWKARKLAILCYHGFALEDEHSFRPKLFVTADLFEQRLRWLAANGYRSLSIGEALSRQAAGMLGPKEFAMTIDDGFHSVAAMGAPMLKKYGFTATIYVTTYYVVHNNPIFRLAVQYYFWKTELPTVNLSDFLGAGATVTPVRGPDGEAAMWKVIELGEADTDEPGRLAMARSLANRLHVDAATVAESRRLTLMNVDEIAELSQQGFDIQLHTHRHRLPAAVSEVNRELVDNRAVLGPLCERPLLHLCYPSGIWSKDLWPSLEEAGVSSATTCESGLNEPHTPKYALRRFLDAQDIPQIVFEAEVSGFAEWVRRIARRAPRTDKLAK
jgi:peptidoglycan/xylan/chitin deacetylase (PgdA/CDA1 family)